MDWSTVTPEDSKEAEKIVEEYMSQGKFDQLRRQLISELDTQPSYQNLKQRMETAVRTFLSKKKWRPDLNKNQLRDNLRKHLMSSPFLRPGISRVIEQVAGPSVIYNARPDLDAICRNMQGPSEENQTTNSPEPEVTVEAINSPEDFKAGTVIEDEKIITDDTVEEVAVPGEEHIDLESFKETEIEISQSPKMELQEEFTEVEQMEVVENEAAAEDSDSDSWHSITNQMSPISIGVPSPQPSPRPPTPTPEPITPPPVTTVDSNAIKRASDFVGKIPKIKKDSPQIIDKGGTNEIDHSKKDSSSPKDDDRKRDYDKRHNSDKERKSSSSSSRDRERSRDSHKTRDKYKSSDKSEGKSRERSRDRDKSRSSGDKDKSKDRGGKRDQKDTEDTSQSKKDEKSKDKEREKSKSTRNEHESNSSREEKYHRTSSDKSKSDSSRSKSDKSSKSSSRSNSSSRSGSRP